MIGSEAQDAFVGRSMIAIATTIRTDGSPSSSMVSFVRDGDAVVGVETTRGRIGAGRVGICVAGHSGQVAALVGLKLPIESQTLQALVTEGVKPMVNS